jgi:hypothetical protein
MFRTIDTEDTSGIRFKVWAYTLQAVLLHEYMTVSVE